MLDSNKGRFPIHEIWVNRNCDGAGKSRAGLVAVAGTGRRDAAEGISRQGLPAMALKTCSRRHMAGWRIVGGGVGKEDGLGAEGLG
jgi:hypothetical protein